MSKLNSLESISKFIDERAKYSFLVHYLAAEVNTEIEFLGQLALCQAEITFHRQKLKQAIRICEAGLNGTESLIVEILNRPPGQKLSKGLLKFLDLLPSYSDEVARTMAPFMANSEGKSEEEVHQQNLSGYLDNIELTAFANSYNDDLLKATQLAESGSDFSAIHKLLL